MEKIIPLFGNVLIKIDEKKKTTEAGIILPDNSSASEKEQLGKIVAVGDDCKLKENDRVLIPKFAGINVAYQGEQFLILKETDVLAIIR